MIGFRAVKLLAVVADVAVVAVVAVDADVAFPANAPVNVVANTLALGKLTVVAFGAVMAMPVAVTLKFLVVRVFVFGLKVRWLPTVSLDIAVFPTALVI